MRLANGDCRKGLSRAACAPLPLRKGFEDRCCSLEKSALPAPEAIAEGLFSKETWLFAVVVDVPKMLPTEPLFCSRVISAAPDGAKNGLDMRKMLCSRLSSRDSAAFVPCSACLKGAVVKLAEAEAAAVVSSGGRASVRREAVAAAFALASG